MKTTEFVRAVSKDAQVRRMLNRSRLAGEVLEALKGGDMYLSELARKIACDASNVHMRIHGYFRRYRESMISLGLVFAYYQSGAKYYGITDYGRKFVR